MEERKIDASLLANVNGSSIDQAHLDKYASSVSPNFDWLSFDTSLVCTCVVLQYSPWAAAVAAIRQSSNQSD